MGRFVRVVSFLVCAVTLSVGCGGNGSVKLLLTDAPGDFKKAVVTIEEIYLQGGDADDRGGRVVLLSSPVTTDLIALANDTAELVKDAAVPAGTYSQLRFVISGGYIEVENGDGSTSRFASSPTYAGLPEGAKVDGSLKMPSYGTSGLKVDIGNVLIQGEQKVLLVDFDVAQSFGHEAGNDKWVMHPVVKGADLTLSASVKVTLQKSPTYTLPPGASLSLITATLTNAGGSKETLAMTDSNDDGIFEAEFLYLIPGAFVIDFEGTNGGHPQTNPARPFSVSLGSGQVFEQSFVLDGF